MRTVGEILKLSLCHVGESRPRHEVEWFIALTLGVSRLDLYLQFDRPLDEEELSKVRLGIARLKRGEPLAYVRNSAPFFKDEYLVSRDVLIPRPETEILVEEACRFLSSQKEPGILFDLCTGSGCVGLSIKKLFPEWHVVLSDISESAISIAKKNAEKFKLDVEFLLGDLFAPFSSKKAHCIVANPPYLSVEEWEHIDSSIRDFEPMVALVGGTTGLEWYERFFVSVREYVYPGAHLFLEMGSMQAKAILPLAERFSSTQVIKDFAHLDRIVNVTI